ncbi:MAG TPA: protease modulator HflK [Thermoguttaceae bacterium]|nr:protease modulator HflK [Thermoguttaceae bacterium]
MTRKRKTADAVFQGLEAGLRMFRWVVVILLVLFVFSGITKVEPDSVGLLLRFGRLQGGSPGEQVKQPGLLLALPFPIDDVKTVSGQDKEGEVVIDEVWRELTEVATTDEIDPVLEGYCLTGDHNIFQAKVVAKYKVSDPIAFELWMDKEDREALLRDVVVASLSQTVASWAMDDALRLQRVAPAPEATTEERLAQTVWHRAQVRLDALNGRGKSKGCGMTISALEFQQRHPPRHVIAEFERVQSAKIAKQTLWQKAKAFENREIPNAQAKANAMVQEATAYKDALVARANADVSEFQQLYEQYQKNPALVWRRIYQETIEYVLGHVQKRLFVSPGTRVVLGEKGESQP